MSEAPQNGGQGNAPTGDGQAWYEGYDFKPEDVGYIQNKKWDHPSKVLESYKNLEKFHGVPADQIIKLPKEGETFDPVWNRLGRPENPEGYGEIKAPEGLTLDNERIKHFDGLAHKLGLTKAQRDNLFLEYAKYERGQSDEGQKAYGIEVEKQLAALKSEWGDKFDERAELGRRAVRAFVPGDAKDALLEAIEKAIGTASTLKLFANIGDKMGEHSIQGSNEPARFGYTKEQALADKSALMSELSSSVNRERLNAYNQGKGPDYDKMRRLNEVIAA